MRDPYTRLISEFYCQWSDRNTTLNTRASYDVVQFNEYIRNTLMKLNKSIQHWLSSTPHKKPIDLLEGHYIPQYVYLLQYKGRNEIRVPKEGNKTIHSNEMKYSTYQSTNEFIFPLTQNKVDVRSVHTDLSITPDISELMHLVSETSLCWIPNVYLIHLENFNYEFNNLMKKFNVPIGISDEQSNNNIKNNNTNNSNPVTNIHHNTCSLKFKENRKFTKDDFDEENIKLIQQIYKFDFIIGGYPF